MKQSFLILLAGLFLAWPAKGWTQKSNTELRLQAMEEKLNALTKEDKKKGQPLQAYFKNGFKLMTPDKKFQFQVGGRIMFDVFTFHEDDLFIATHENLEAGAGFRRARLFIAGKMWSTLRWKFQVDFADNDNFEDAAFPCTVQGGAPGATCTVTGQDRTLPEFKDAYIQLTKLPYVGNIRVGHFKEPWSLETQTSSKYMTFMNRSLVHESFAVGHNSGIAFFNHWNQRVTWNIGVFYDSGQEAPPLTATDFTPGRWNAGFRLTGNPWYKDKGRQVVHLGFSFQHQDRGRSDTIDFDADPEVDGGFAGDFTETLSIPAEDVTRHLFEGAVVYGPFSLQGEYAQAGFDQVSTGINPGNISETSLDAWYIEASYWLTGEHRNYKRTSGYFGRTKIKNPFKSDFSGLGGLQVGLRYSEADFNDEDDPNLTGAGGGVATAGGEEENFTAGVNWHLNNNTRVMFNYVHADFTQGTRTAGPVGADGGSLDAYTFRFQIDF